MRIGILFFATLFSSNIFSAQPLLIDVKIIGSAQSPLFEPQNFTLDVGQDYLFVISNEGTDSISFDYGNFGQKVLTHSMQGTSSMTQQSIVINPNSKVQWLFSPQLSGEYTYHAINTSLNSKGNAGKITVNKNEKELVQTQTALETKESTQGNDKNANKKRF